METKLELVSIAEQINNLHRHADEQRDVALTHAANAIRHALQCGALLIKARSLCAHGEWELWLESNCPNLSQTTARRYMTVSANVPDVEHLPTDCQSVTKLLRAVGITPEPEAVEQSPTKTITGWLRWTPKIDAMIPKLSPDEKLELRRWCESTLERL